MVAVLGVPSDENSSFLRGCALAPEQIRKALHSDSSNLCTESGIDLGEEPRFRDLGDLDLGSGTEAFDTIERSTAEILRRGGRPLVLGGDHAITWPILRAFGKVLDGVTILHLDAHPDLYDEFDGNRSSHASPFARIMEEGLAARLVQVGIRTLNPHQKEQAERFGVEIIEMRDWQRALKLVLEGPLYLTIDMDVLDPACAPGVSHREPGGLQTRELLDIVQSTTAYIAGADLVEFNPYQDTSGMTAMVAAKILKELAARMLDGGGS